MRVPVVLALVVAALTVGAGAAYADAPTAYDDAWTTGTGVPLSVSLYADDLDGDPLTYAVVAGPSHGTLTGDCSDADCTYTPAAGYAGPDSFTWKANDGTSDSNVATFDIDVTAPAAPTAYDDSQTAVTGAPLSVYLSADDPDGDPLTYSVVSGPSHGTLTGDCSDGDCTYTSGSAYTGPDSFTWKANDGTSDSNVATFALTVTAPGAPTAFDDSREVGGDTDDHAHPQRPGRRRRDPGVLDPQCTRPRHAVGDRGADLRQRILRGHRRLHAGGRLPRHGLVHLQRVSNGTLNQRPGDGRR